MTASGPAWDSCLEVAPRRRAARFHSPVAIGHRADAGVEGLPRHPAPPAGEWQAGRLATNALDGPFVEIPRRAASGCLRDYTPLS